MAITEAHSVFEDPSNPTMAYNAFAQGKKGHHSHPDPVWSCYTLVYILRFQLEKSVTHGEF
jgi:hypothetical protein